MWTTLENCFEGDYIRAYFLGDTNIDDIDNLNWHKIYELQETKNGKYYAAIEGFRGSELYGNTDVYKRL